MASRRFSSLVSRSFMSSPSLFALRGKNSNVNRGAHRYSNLAAAAEDTITPPVKVEHTQLLIHGKFVDSASGQRLFFKTVHYCISTPDYGMMMIVTGKTFPTLDPRTGDVIAQVAEGDVEDVNRAVSAARKAFDEGPWPRMTAYPSLKLATADIAALETWDNGKPFEQSAKIEVPMLARAGLPEGVVNIVSGFGPTAGAAIASHMDIDKVAFTGSTDVGKIVLELASKSNLKAVTLELGGKSPFIVCEDADVDQAVELAHFALFFNQGQCCCAGSRTFVHERVYDEFVEKAKARAINRAVGDPFKSGIEQGPQVDSEQFKKILKYIKHGVESGATLQAGGDRFGSKGYYIQPTVFSDVKDDMLIATDEIFGPVQTILKFKNLDEVIARANKSRYGLAAGVFTHNLDTANRLMRALRVGSVWINCFDVFDATIPFGGYKMSGIGREKGIYSLNNYLQVKAVVTTIKNPAWL
ncbi:hypothetical protein Bca4012_062466 [Brassica carinata]